MKVRIETLDRRTKVYYPTAWHFPYVCIIVVLLILGAQIALAFNRYVLDDYRLVRYSVLSCSEICLAKSKKQLTKKFDSWDDRK